MKKILIFIIICLSILACILSFVFLKLQKKKIRINSLASLSVDKNHFVDQNGNIVVLRGASRWSLEFSCGDGHFQKSDFQAMKSWGMNIVRIPLNENYFLHPELCPTNYQTTAFNAVEAAKKSGLYVLLDLHWIHPQEVKNIDERGGQFPMPDYQAIQFWEIIAQRYKNDPQILFEFMNEPHAISCSVWKNGGDVTSIGNTGWIHQAPGIYKTPGFQQLVNTVRSIGAHNVIVQGTSGESDLSCITNAPLYDPAQNLAYQVHFYTNSPLGTWGSKFKNLFSSHAILAGEFDEKQAIPVLDFFQNQLQTGYLAWAWHTEGGMIADYSGTPLGTIWQEVHDFMLRNSQ